MLFFEPVLSALNRRGIRFVVVGGVAVVLHGHLRLTADLDLAIDLRSDNAARTIDALVDFGLTPMLPVPAGDFADPGIRRKWVDEHNLKVFTLHDVHNPVSQVDLFADNPIPFDDLWKRAVEVVLKSTTIRIASIEDLIAMKQLAGRPQDLADIAAIEAIRADRLEP